MTPGSHPAWKSANEGGLAEVWEFARVEEFWAGYEALTPRGRERRAERRIYVEPGAIGERSRERAQAGAWLERASQDRSSLDRVSYHLKRIPRLPEPGKEAYELAELHQAKKFLANYRAVMGLLDEACLSSFGIGPVAADLAGALDIGGSDAETFYLADAYSPALAGARLRIAALDGALREERAGSEARARDERGLDFDGREFLVVPVTAAMALASSGEGYVVEAYDNASCVVRLPTSPERLRLAAERAAALEVERVAEEEVLARLSAMAGEALPELWRAAEALADFDLARGAAILAKARGLVEPEWNADGSSRFEASGGRFIPMEEECAAMGLAYTPLDIALGEGPSLLFGSNMGGKTVALRTVLFLQLMAQAGLGASATRLRTRPYRTIRYIGELSGERLAGLSGFGFEISRLLGALAEIAAGLSGADGSVGLLGSDARPGADAAAFVALDEFARTTGSHEAEALISALIESLRRVPGLVALFSTHFRGVARLEGVGYLRMGGLGKGALEDGGSAVEAGGLAERVRRINRRMDYRVVPDDGGQRASDAIAIAAMLGLDPAVAERAMGYLDGGKPADASPLAAPRANAEGST